MENQDNKVRLKKIPLSVFIDALMNIYDMGIDYVDIIGVPGEEQDQIGIAFSDEYMSKEENDSPTEEPSDEEIKEEIKNIKLSDDDLNQLL